MPKRKSTFDLPIFDEKPAAPLRQWLYRQLRAAILAGRLEPGARLPSSRSLAAQYGMARGTVVEAFEQLASEGYVRGGVGAGTFVRANLPDALLQSDPRATRGHAAIPAEPSASLSRRAAALRKWSSSVGAHPRTIALFNPYLPALEEFPLALWGRLVSRRAHALDRSLLGDDDARGYLPLRRNIAHYLAMTRGISAHPDQILVLSSVQQALDLSARLLLDEGDAAWIEDPGYPGAREVLGQARTRLVPVPVDGAGMQVNAGKRSCGSARLVYLTPARQAPLGVGLALSRRLELLDWAAQSGAWIFEDDYDGEFRYRGRPLAALHAIDPHGCVIYAGSFSKTLFPALRISYLVVPPALVDAFAAARSLTTRYAPVLEQAVLSDFIEQGHYARHLRRMNTLYAERRAALVTAVDAAPQVFESIAGDEAGLALVAWLKSGLTEQDAVRAGRDCRLFIHPLGPYVMNNRQRPGLILGFAAGTPAQLRHAVSAFVAAIAPDGVGCRVRNRDGKRRAPTT